MSALTGEWERALNKKFRLNKILEQKLILFYSETI